MYHYQRYLTTSSEYHEKRSSQKPLSPDREALRGPLSVSLSLTFLSFVLLPLSYGIFFDFLAGNLVASFMQARTLLEQLAKCYLADIGRNRGADSIRKVL